MQGEPFDDINGAIVLLFITFTYELCDKSEFIEDILCVSLVVNTNQVEHFLWILTFSASDSLSQ